MYILRQLMESNPFEIHLTDVSLWHQILEKKWWTTWQTKPAVRLLVQQGAPNSSFDPSIFASVCLVYWFFHRLGGEPNVLPTVRKDHIILTKIVFAGWFKHFKALRSNFLSVINTGNWFWCIMPAIFHLQQFLTALFSQTTSHILSMNWT